MRSLTLFLVAAVLSIAASAVPVHAECVNPQPPPYSYIDPTLLVCPYGDTSFRVFTRNLLCIVFATVYLDCSNCPGFAHCPSLPPEYGVNEATRRIWMHTDNTANAYFHLPMGGLCAGAAVRVYGDQNLLATRTLVSPDQDGDLRVTSNDRVMLQAKIGTADLTGDLNGDGVVSDADVTVLDAHMNHTCDGIVPALPPSWGRLKSIYR